MIAPARQRIGLAGACLVILGLGLSTWRFHAKLPAGDFPWQAWSDQHKYFVDAQAWSAGNLDPALHHYLPGYGLCGALFIKLMPWQPFLVPDMISFLICLGAFCAIAHCLVPRSAAWRLAAPLLFGAATLGTLTLRNLWLIPWSTTGSAPFAFIAVLAAILAARRQSILWTGMLGVALGLCAGFRPADAFILLLCCSAHVLLHRMPPISILRRALGLGAGLLAGTSPWLAAHVAAHGLSLGAYLGRMSEMGFEWRLLPLRWVQIGIDARPMLPDGPGIVGGYPWMALGFAGLLFGALVQGPARPAWRLILAAILLHWALYLCYRDLYPEGLWRYFNVHYFKWSFPFLALAAARLVCAFARAGERRPAILCVCAICSLLLWRPWLDVGAAPATQGVIGADLSRFDGAALIPVSGDWQSIYFSKSELLGDGRTFLTQTDFKLLPLSDGALLVPLRRLAAPPLQLRLDARLRLRGAGYDAVQRIRFGLPCFMYRPGCKEKEAVLF